MGDRRCCCDGGICTGCVPGPGPEDKSDLVLTFHSDDCDEIEGIQRTLVWSDEAFEPPATGAWVYESEDDPCFGPIVIAITLDCWLCHGDGVRAYVFSIEADCFEVINSAMGCAVDEESCCDPFCIVYRGFEAAFHTGCSPCQCIVDPGGGTPLPGAFTFWIEVGDCPCESPPEDPCAEETCWWTWDAELRVWNITTYCPGISQPCHCVDVGEDPAPENDYTGFLQEMGCIDED